MIPALLLATALMAQEPETSPQILPNGVVNYRDHVSIDQRLGESIDLDLEFRDESGQTIALRELFDTRPVILVLAYYECPMLCTMVLNGTVKSMRAIRDLECGVDYELVVVSIDPGEHHELAAEKRATYAEKYTSDAGRVGGNKGWHFLTGDEPAIQALADQVGFRYVYDPREDEYAHASGIMVATPGGELARYFYGVEFIAKDIRLGLIEASEGKIGTLADKILLLCYHYDPTTGKYGLLVANITRILGALTVLIIAGSIFKMIRRDRRMSAARLEEAPHVG